MEICRAWHSPPHSLIQHGGTPLTRLLFPCLIKQAVSVPRPQFQFYSSIINIHYSAKAARGRSARPAQLFIQQYCSSVLMIPSVSPYCYSKQFAINFLCVDGPNERPLGELFSPVSQSTLYLDIKVKLTQRDLCNGMKLYFLSSS